MGKVILIFISIFFFSANANANAYNSWGNSCGWNMMNFGWRGGIVMWLLFLFLIGLIVYFIIRSIRSDGSNISYKETPLEILKNRYANGEINKEKFKKMKQDLLL